MKLKKKWYWFCSEGWIHSHGVFFFWQRSCSMSLQGKSFYKKKQFPKASEPSPVKSNLIYIMNSWCYNVHCTLYILPSPAFFSLIFNKGIFESFLIRRPPNFPPGLRRIPIIGQTIKGSKPMMEYWKTHRVIEMIIQMVKMLVTRCLGCSLVVGQRSSCRISGWLRTSSTGRPTRSPSLTACKGRNGAGEAKDSWLATFARIQEGTG